MARHAQRGVSLIEVMVGMALGLISVLIMTQAFSVNDAARRSTASASDSVQIGALASHYLNTDLQDAGAGLVRSGDLWGCQLNVTRNGNVLLPRPSAFPAPFAAVPQTLRAAPVVVFDGGSNSDVVLVMSGNSASANRDLEFDKAASGDLVFTNPIGFLPNDLLLAVRNESAVLGNAPCQIVQIASDYQPSGDANPTETYGGLNALKPANDVVSLSGVYGALADTVTANVGAAQNLGQNPVIAMYGVNANNELVRYSVLDDTSTVLAENVYRFKAILGVDTDDVGRQNPDAVGKYAINEWKAPSDTGWSASTLLAGNEVAAQKLDLILALRVGLIIQSASLTPAESKDFVLFESDATNKINVTLSGTEKRRRYSVNETIIPLRNLRSAYRGG